MTIKQFLVNISSVLDQLKIDYIITGGVAVTVWGKPRYTADIDIVVEIDSVESVRALILRLKKTSPKSFPDMEMAIDAFKRKSEFNVIESEYGIKADFFISDKSEYKKLEIKRGKLKKLDGKMIRFISPEDLIISKLMWFKESQSTRQLEDIISVMDVQKKLDQPYIDKWVKILRIEKEWRELKK
ncbi:MAG TPA: hypothetical protein VJK26_01340 [Patescibacteria group bacterium]|nr:hypothetical protein [Patescibacteria group bacterium]